MTPNLANAAQARKHQLHKNISYYLTNDKVAFYAFLMLCRRLSPMTTTITISLPGSLKTYIEEQVAHEGFGTVSEYLRALVRDEQKRKAQLRLESLLLEGLQSEASALTDEDWDDMRREIRRRHDKRKRAAK
jgi:antitoxin ParD1/3/4